MRNTRFINLTLFAVNVALVIAAFHWVGCATPPRNQYREPTAPGFYNVRGWGYQPVYFANQNAEGTASDLDVKGNVGMPLTLSGPNALAIPTHQWTATDRMISGSLPPGLTMDGSGVVSGIPTQNGHWICTFECYDMETNGTTYFGFQQQVRFHILGGGQVHE